MNRVKVPGGVKLMPHRRSEDRIYTVMSGVFYIGQGDKFDADKLQAYPPGAVIFLPANTSHYHWAKSGEYVAQRFQSVVLSKGAEDEHRNYWSLHKKGRLFLCLNLSSIFLTLRYRRKVSER